ncbi:GNAT family N-acetyltransferase [Brachybacterium sacelli]|uniref:RimJ/RimL family protein N-acetyltransferase n=1 Tax=Brachybacterium sacelli TaxID=173364 RepID=A0ABS4WWG1_9MICO|nr:GNAT family N-acetyltransferase [Brachybacterium sacelli]MBP2380539.1 RimJ/RimL family protein N-acetyltransferase [Brachybacterium sacelli]
MTSDASPAFTIDAPRLEDAEALARIHVRSWEVAYAHLIQGEQWFGREAVVRRTAQWKTWLTPGTRGADEGICRAGRDAEGTVIGLAASWPPRDAQPVPPRELSLLYIEEAWFGTGLGRALAEAILEHGPATVWVAEENPRARRFYEKLGFAADGATQVEEHLGGIRDVRMVR